MSDSDGVQCRERKGARVCDPQQFAAQSNRLRLTEPRSAKVSLSSWCSFAAILFLLLSSASVSATVRYVDMNSASPTPPYTNWATAAQVIQDAVDAAAPGDTILVTNGVYATGGRPVGTNLLSNRVAIEKPIRLESVNGPAVTIIEGARSPAGDERGNGDGAVRCVYLGFTNAVLSGFTLTNGHTRTNGDYVRDRSAGGVFGGTSDQMGGVVTNCVIAGNSANDVGGGACGGRLYNCTLSGNLAYAGGGAGYSTLYNCTVTGNSAVGDSFGNAGYGGGAYGATLYSCSLMLNSADYGGGAYGATLYNCTLTGNSARYRGGGVYGDALNYIPSTLNNCIVYFNTAPSGANYYGCSLNHCCTTPLPLEGSGNFSLDPQLASVSHLSTSSPCRGAGSAAYATGTDIDGEAWANPPSIGCDEYHVGGVTGPLNVGVAAYTNVAVGFPVELMAFIEGTTTASVWDFGDGTTVSNRPYATHAWTTPGDFAVVLQAYNESYPNGVSVTVTVHVVTQPVHFVATNSANPVPPYTSWATAATNIQDAVDVASTPGALVLVTNGVYAAGGRAEDGWKTNRVVVAKPIRVRSVNGPQFTVIDGGGVDRCVYLSSGAGLSGFTLTNGVADSGGGLWCESVTALVSNCVVTGNWAYGDYSSYGGGAYGGTLINCTFTGNWAYTSTEHGIAYGGGAFGSTLFNCTLIGNSSYGSSESERYPAAGYGGGVADSTLYNCTVIDNSSDGDYGYGAGGGAYGSTLYICTLTNNSAYGGGGASGSTLTNCTLAGNSASHGGGAWGSSLNNCVLTNNSAVSHGGGADQGTLYSCTLTGNSAQNGGGASFGTLNNCTLTGNSAWQSGGGASVGTLYNCTIIGNSAGVGGGGVYYATLSNCIVYFNTATNGANYYDDGNGGVVTYSCTTPLPSNGVGNITADPLFVDAANGDFRLRPGSPCIDTGTNLTGIITTDITGLPRPMDGNYDGHARFDMGAYEFNPYRFGPTLSLGPDGFRFTIRGEPGRSVRIERSHDLVNWEFAGEVPIPTSGQTLIDPAATCETQLFYRAMRTP